MSNISRIAAFDRDARPRPAALEFATDVATLCELLTNAPPGRSIAYHVGALARDRYPNLSTLSDARRRQLNEVADYVLRLAAAGRVNLTQRRLDEERFLYLLEVRRQPRSAPTVHGRPHACLIEEAA